MIWDQALTPTATQHVAHTGHSPLDLCQFRIHASNTRWVPAHHVYLNVVKMIDLGGF
mgnify:CR=1 FL=1